MFWVMASGGTVAWALISPTFKPDFLVLVFPVSTLSGTALLVFGWYLLYGAPRKTFEAYAAAGAFSLWGIHVMDFPFLFPVAWFAPYGFLISYVLQRGGAFALLIHHYRRTHEELRESLPAGLQPN